MCKNKWKIQWCLDDTIVESWAKPWAMRLSSGAFHEEFVAKYEKVAQFFESLQSTPHRVDMWEDQIWAHVRPIGYIMDEEEEALY